MPIERLHRLVSIDGILAVLGHFVHVEEEIRRPRIVVATVPSVLGHPRVGGVVVALQLLTEEPGITDKRLLQPLVRMPEVPFRQHHAHADPLAPLVAVIALASVVVLVDGTGLIVIYHVGAIAGVCGVVHLLMVTRMVAWVFPSLLYTRSMRRSPGSPAVKQA